LYAKKKKEQKCAYIQLYGVTAEEIQAKVDKDDISQMNLAVHRAADEQYGLPVNSVALAVGEKAERLHSASTPD